MILLRNYLPNQLSIGVVRIYDKMILSAVPDAEILNLPQNSVFSDRSSADETDLPKVFKEGIMWRNNRGYQEFLNIKKASNENWPLIGIKFKFPAKISNFVWTNGNFHHNHMLYLRDDFPTVSDNASWDVVFPINRSYLCRDTFSLTQYWIDVGC